ncbi:hypothetical protein [Mameliella sp. MMSF_3455]|uniref:hypothetical protein n=1 Tax=Mameliella sp. MMSF_3455 TaxID=3046714 RepID=UPI00273E9FBE|nr:hypothetical protein [Mameliella sp. MMSF_3455]
MIEEDLVGSKQRVGGSARMGPLLALFHKVSLEDHMPQDHLLRSIDRYVNNSGLRSHLADFCGQTGINTRGYNPSTKKNLNKAPSSNLLLSGFGRRLTNTVNPSG